MPPAEDDPGTVPGASVRFTIACVAALLVGTAVVGLGTEWTVACPETGASGWMDCGGQPDAEWRADGLPNWVTPQMLVIALAVSLLVLAGTFLDHRRARRRVRPT